MGRRAIRLLALYLAMVFALYHFTGFSVKDPEIVPAFSPLTAESEPEPEETADTREVGVLALPEEPDDDPTVLYSEAWLSWFQSRIQALQKELPDGSYWNHAGRGSDWLGTTDIPCNHNLYGIAYCNIYNCASTNASGFGYGTQCAAFAGYLSDRIFGADAPVYKFYDYDQIRPGDQARIGGDTHSVFIIAKTDEYVVVAECNAQMNNCRVDWGRIIPREKMRGFYLTRSPLE